MAIVRDRDRFLVIERAAGVPFPGFWGPLSGKVEPGESLEDAVIREVREEVGLLVVPGARVWQCASQDGQFQLHWWLAQPVAGELRPDPREVAAVRWIRADEFASLAPVFTPDRTFFAQILPAL